MPLSIGQLFNKDRLNGNVFQLLFLIFYAPLGLVLVLLRCFISLQLIIAVALLPQNCFISRFVTRALCCTLGLVVRQNRAQNKSLSSSVQHLGSNSQLPSGRRRLVLLSNHVSVFDHLVLSLLVPCVKVEGNGEGIPRLVSSLLGCQVLAAGHGDRNDGSGGDNLVPALQRFVGAENVAGSDSLVASSQDDKPDGDAGSEVRQRSAAAVADDKVSSSDNSASTTQPSRDAAGSPTVQHASPSLSHREFEDWPLLLFPECSTTNGTVALMQYEKWAGRVSPSMTLLVGVSARRVPPLPLTLAVSPPSGFLQEIFSLFFCPFTVYTVTCVGEVSQQGGETEDSFCKRLQTTTAQALGLQASDFSLHDKAEYMKALAAVQRRVAAAHHSPAVSHHHARDDPMRGGSELRQMVTQVHEVLPDVPVAAIWRDLMRSGNVDVTITNFLEGAVPEYTPSTTNTASSASSSSSMSSSSNQVFANISPNQPLSSTPTRVSSLPTNLSPSSNVSPAAGSGSDISVDKSGCSSSFSCSSINLSTKADSFPRSACDRMLSFNQRKAVLLENALKKYVENFGLNGERDPYLKCS